MSVYISRPTVSPGWEVISQRLTEFVNAAELVSESDVIIYCFDDSVPSWEDDPAAWYSPKTREICLNMTKILRKKITQKFFGKSTFKYKKTIALSDGSPMYVLSEQGVTYLEGELIYRVTGAYMGKYSKGSGILEKWCGVDEKIHAILNFDYEDSYYENSEKMLNSVLSTILGVIVHETGHSVFSDFITEKWWSKLTENDRQVITMMEELRIEAKQVERLGGNALPVLTSAYAVVLDVEQQVKDLEKYSGEDGVTDEEHASMIAVSSILTLGRTVYGGYKESEVGHLALAVEISVGGDRYAEMFNIWRDYCNLDSITSDSVDSIMTRWNALFPPTDFKSSVAPSVRMGVSDDEASGSDDEHVIIDGSKKSSEEFGHEGEDPVTTSGGGDSEDDSDEAEYSGEDEEEHVKTVLDTDDSGKESHGLKIDGDDEASDSPGKKKSSTVVDALIVVSHEVEEKLSKVKTQHKLTTGSAAFSKISSHSRYSKVKPPKKDFETARKMTHALQRIYVTGKDRFHVNTELPPGRLRSRAAVQNAAYRQQGVRTRKKQWERTKVTVDVNPQLTVGVMTDVSGSQGWCEELSMRTSWILSKAFRSVNARTASVAFGARIYMPSLPGEPMHEQIRIEADQMTEMFDAGLGALDHVLKLSNGLGVKMLFVLTDGIFVEPNENAKANQWIKILKDAGCKTVWIHPKGVKDNVPPDAVSLPVLKGAVSSEPEKLIDDVIKIIEDELYSVKLG